MNVILTAKALFLTFFMDEKFDNTDVNVVSCMRKLETKRIYGQQTGFP